MGLEIPEILTISEQMKENLLDKEITNIILTKHSESTIKQGMSNLDNRNKDILNSKIKRITSKGKWIFLEFKNGSILMFGEIIGKFLYIKKDLPLPPKYHVSFQFDDGSIVTLNLFLYAFIVVATLEEKKVHRYAGNIGISPNESEFTLDYFLHVLSNNENKSIKAALNLQEEMSGLGNAYINDILYMAKIHPKRKVSDLKEIERNNLYDSIIKTINSAIELGGSSDEYDLYGNLGKYVRLMGKNTNECKLCGNKILKENILGSSSYFCPVCQKYD